MSLFDKITTPEAFEQTLEGRAAIYGDNPRTYRVESVFYTPWPNGARYATEHGSVGGNHTQLPARLWWLARESARWHKSGGYGQVLDMLWNDSRFAVFCPKPHKADLTKIEVFMDAESAIADRPMVTTLGRFLRKVCAVFSDEYMRDLDEMHRADMNDEFEVLTTVEDIRKAYLEGPSSCMSKYFHDFNVCRGGELENRAKYSNGYHPVDAYAEVPGMGIAVLRDSHGRINARCLVWENPDKPEDKRAVRVYGDGTLKRRLLRRGFRMAGLAGARLRALPIPEYGKKSLQIDKPGVVAYAIPYLDGVDGARSGVHSAPTVVKYKGDDHLTFIDNATNQKLQAFLRKKGIDTNYASSGGDASGVGVLKEIDKDDLVITCAVTGIKYQYDDPSVGNMVNVVMPDGSLASAVSSPALMEKFPLFLHVHLDGSWVDAYAPADTPCFTHRGGVYRDGEDERRIAGYFKLVREFYPDDDKWYCGRTMPESPITRIKEGYILRKDAASVVAKAEWGGIEVTHVHKSQFTPDKYIKVHSRTVGEVLYADKTLDIRKTDTGRLVVMGFHDVMETYDGRVMFTRRIAEVSYIDTTDTYWVSRDQLASVSREHFCAAHKPESEHRKRAVQRVIDRFSNEKNREFRNVRLGAANSDETNLFAIASGLMSRVWVEEINGLVRVRTTRGYATRYDQAPDPVERLGLMARVITEGEAAIDNYTMPLGYREHWRNAVIEFMAVFKEARRQLLEAGIMATGGDSERISALLDAQPAPAQPVPATSDEALAALATEATPVGEAIPVLEALDNLLDAAETSLNPILQAA